MLPLNIRVDMNCQPTWVTQNAIPREQELISLGGGHYDPPPDKVGLRSPLSLIINWKSKDEHYKLLQLIKV